MSSGAESLWEQGDVPKVGYFRDIPVEFKIKSLYSNDLILNVASKSKETVQKLKFLDSPSIYGSRFRLIPSGIFKS